MFWVQCSGTAFLNVSNETDGTTRVKCTVVEVFSMQWNIMSSELNIFVSEKTIDVSTMNGVLITEFILLTSSYIPPIFPSVVASIESVMTISSSFESSDPIVFTCSGLSSFYGPFTVEETVIHQGLAAPTTSEYLYVILATVLNLKLHHDFLVGFVY